MLHTPNGGQIGEAFRHDIISEYFIVNQEVFSAIKLKFLCKEDPTTQQPIDLSFDLSDFRILEPGEHLFKLAAKARAKELYDSIEDKNDNDAPQDFRNSINAESIKDEITRISVKYQVLTGETAFVGVIKQDDKTTGELTKVVIPTTISGQAAVIQPPNYYGVAGGMNYRAAYRGGGGGRGGRGGPQLMMKKSAAMPMSRAAAMP